MASYLPVSSDGTRRFSVVTGSGTYNFRSYFVSGAGTRWVLDIHDSDGVPLLVGIALLPGSRNLLAGQGDTFGGSRLFALLTEGSAGDPEALGTTLHLLWLEPGEESPFPDLDPMDTIPARLS